MEYPWKGGWPELPERTVARNITTILRYRKMSQTEFARQMDVAPPQVTKWLQQDDDSYTIKTIRRSAKVLSVPTFALIVPLFDPEYRQISVTARYLYIAYRFGSHWPRIYRWIQSSLDLIEEALSTSSANDEFVPFDLLAERDRPKEEEPAEL
jgi:transcriptional regulator with XRE-family HTH domain